MRELHKNYPYSKLNGFIQKYNRKDNTSGVNGVCFDNTLEKWVARLNYNHKFYWGGKHKHKISAIKARLKLEFDVFGIDKMPQRSLIPEYFKSSKSKILKAYNELEEK